MLIKLRKKSVQFIGQEEDKAAYSNINCSMRATETEENVVTIGIPSSAFVELATVMFRHACKLGLEGIVSKRLGSPYRSGRSRHWIKSKNPRHPAVKREAEEDWAR
jgi:hypothetical protein